MNNPREASLRWTVGEIIASKPLTVLALTAVWVYVLIQRVIDPISTPLAKLLHISTGSVGESVFVITLLVLGLAAAFVLSVVLLNLAYNLVLSRMDPAEAAAWHAKSARPKWNIAYSLILGYLLLLILSGVGRSVYDQWFESTDTGSMSGPLMIILGCLVCGILPYIIAALAVMGINKMMVRLTRTNQELIEEIRAGKHNDKILAEYRNEEDIEGIIKVLNGAQASTVRGAVTVYWIKRSLVVVARALAKVSRVTAIVAVVVGVILSMGCLKLVDVWGNEIHQNVLADIAASEARAEADRAAAAAAAEAEDRRREKWFKARQADKRARFDEQQAAKAVRNNPNTYSTGTKIRRAEWSRREAKRLDKEKYRD